MPLECANVERSIKKIYFSSGCSFRHMAEMAVEGLTWVFKDYSTLF